jgi:hypothetical protein
MITGEDRFKYIEEGRKSYWTQTRYICVPCVGRIYGFDKIPQSVVYKEVYKEVGTVKRFLRPITPNEMKGEKI